MNKPQRNTLLVEDAEILDHAHHAGAQHTLRVRAPRIAQRAQAGSFVHLQCDPLLPMRRPISIMRVDADAGWVEFLYKVFGHGTRLLARRKPGECVSMIGLLLFSGAKAKKKLSKGSSLIISGIYFGLGTNKTRFIK